MNRDPQRLQSHALWPMTPHTALSMPITMPFLVEIAPKGQSCRGVLATAAHLRTCPIMLYRLLKKVNQSFSTCFSLSAKSSHSGRQSSTFRDDSARAREASLPANTIGKTLVRTLTGEKMKRFGFGWKERMQKQGNSGNLLDGAVL